MIIDIQQIMIASLMAQIFEVKIKFNDEDLLRHMVMNMVLQHPSKIQKRLSCLKYST